MNHADHILRLTKLLLHTYREMVRMKSCEAGEKSHMLAHHTNFIKETLNKIIKLQMQGGGIEHFLIEAANNPGADLDFLIERMTRLGLIKKVYGPGKNPKRGMPPK